MLQYDKTYRSICERNYQKNLENYGVRIFKISTANAGGGGGYNFKIFTRHFKRRDLDSGMFGEIMLQWILQLSSVRSGLV